MNDNQTVNLEAYDDYIKTVNWLQETNLPVALVLTETLQPVEGLEAIIFPPTFARQGGDHPYSIDVLRKDLEPQAAQGNQEVNTCLIDSVGSQANRMEACFKLPPLSALVPQITVQAGDQQVNLLDAGHRIADAAIRFSESESEAKVRFEIEARNAIQEMKLKSNAAPLARLAPTSLVFGFWDSRDTGFKSGRLLASTIRATNVRAVSRSGQYKPSFDKRLLGLSAHENNALAEIGLDDVPVPSINSDDKPVIRVDGRVVGAHGGVRVFGKITRRSQINLVGLRSLAAINEKGTNEQAVNDPRQPKQTKTDPNLKLRRYILGLALVAARYQTDYALREGCNLRRSEWQAQLVYLDGDPQDFSEDWSIAKVFAYAEAAARDFGVNTQACTINFKVEKVKEVIKKNQDEGDAKSRGKSRK
jgi:CRISPR-associated protein Csb1